MASPAQIELPRIAGYEVLRALAHGGMGDVFVARPFGSDQTVALKILRPESVPRFERETELVQHLSHPGLVRVLAHGVSEGRRYFVMEYVAGRNLRALLTPGQPLLLSHACSLLSDIADALVYLEQKGIVHRDLKPENVLLDEQGRVCLTDFGLCVRIDEVGLLTQSNQAVGTYDYMAPEQRARLPMDARADQFALAVLAFEMLTGRRPHGRFKPPSQSNPRLARAVDDVLLRALQEDPDDRYPDTASFAGALHLALTPSPAHPRRALLIGGALLLIACGMVVRGARDQGPGARDQGQGKREEIASSLVPGPLPLAPHKDVRQLVAEANQHAAEHRRIEAIACLTEAIRLAPGAPKLLVDRAHSLLLSNEPKKALADLESALHLDPQLAAAYAGRGAVHLQERRYDNALADLTTALRLDPSHATAHAQRGRLRHQRNEVGLALEDLNRAIELDRTCGLAYHFRGLTRQKLGSHELALEDLRESVRLTPSNPFAHSALASALVRSPVVRLRDTAGARKHARMACELTAWKEASLLRLLASAHAAADDRDEAIRLCDRALLLRISEQERRLIQSARSRYLRKNDE